MIVQFTQRFGAYNCGEIAGFSETEAQNLIERGFAVVKPMPAPVQKESSENKSIPVPPITKEEGHQKDSQPTENQGPESTEDPQISEKNEELEKTSDSDKKNKKK